MLMTLMHNAVLVPAYMSGLVVLFTPVHSASVPML